MFFVEFLLPRVGKSGAELVRAGLSGPGLDRALLAGEHRHLHRLQRGGVRGGLRSAQPAPARHHGPGQVGEEGAGQAGGDHTRHRLYLRF